MNRHISRHDRPGRYLVSVDGEEGQWITRFRRKRRALEFAWHEAHLARGATVVVCLRPYAHVATFWSNRQTPVGNDKGPPERS